MTESHKAVLIVEDDHLVRTMAVAMVEETGLRTLEAEDADKALALLKDPAIAGDVVAVFTDVRMPGRLDGVDLAREIARSWPTVRIIVTSGYAAGRRGELPETAVFLQKPWLPLQLLTLLNSAADHAADVDRSGMTMAQRNPSGR
ncbi:response regulator [Alsobacter sp. SYSU BS001988]